MKNQQASGVAIQAIPDPNNPRSILLRGKFAVSCGSNGVPEEPRLALKHLVMVVSRTSNYQALTPFREVVVFDDDIKVHEDSCSASFNLSVMDHIAFEGQGDYYILCSLGTHLSNVVKVSLG